MPQLSDSMSEGTVLSWLKADGEQVGVGDELVEIETDKAAMTYAAEAAGYLVTIANEGETCPVGSTIARLLDRPPDDPPSLDGESPSTVQPSGPPLPVAGPDAGLPPPAPATPPTVPSAVRISPLARRMALKHDVDPADVRGSGPGGDIVVADIAIAAGVQPDRGRAGVATQSPVREDSLSRLRRHPSPSEPGQGRGDRDRADQGPAGCSQTDGRIEGHRARVLDGLGLRHR